MKRYWFILLLLTFSFGLYAQQLRYVERVFDSVTIDSGVYATAPQVNFPYNDESSTTLVDLKYDIYLPFGDTVQYRPMIIFVHGGGFIEGNRHHDDMVAFCDTFSHAGYVTATIDYRQGMYVADENFTPISGARAVYRGLQDMRSAIRYFRANYQTFGIDTNKIYVVGSSAGAFMALHDLFMTKAEERPPETYDTTYHNPLDNPLVTGDEYYTAPDLGGYDIGDNLSHDGRANLIVGLWGALGDTAFIQSDELRPVMLVHGTADAIVPFGLGSPFGISYLPQTMGSELINQKLNELGYTDKETYFVNGVGHEFYGALNGAFDCDTCPNAYWDTIVNKIKVFMWDHHRPQVSMTVSQDTTDSVYTYTFTLDTSGGVVKIYWLVDGQVVAQDTNTFVYTLSATKSTHTIEAIGYNSIESWDTATYTVAEPVTAVENLEASVKIYPNPANGIVNIVLPDANEVYTVRIINNLGQAVYEVTAKNRLQVTSSEFLPGIYYVEVRGKNRRIVSKLIITP